jgi:hypothetical protein
MPVSFDKRRSNAEARKKNEDNSCEPRNYDVINQAGALNYVKAGRANSTKTVASVIKNHYVF